MIEETTITLYLASWQKRLIKDHLKAQTKRLGIVDPYVNLTKMAFHKPDHSIVTYRVPDPGQVLEGWFNLYLTDEQIAQVTQCTGAKIKLSAVMISPAMLKEKIVVFD